MNARRVRENCIYHKPLITGTYGASAKRTAALIGWSESHAVKMKPKTRDAIVTPECLLETSDDILDNTYELTTEKK